MGMWILPGLLVALVLVWGGFFVVWPVRVNPFAAIGYFEGRPLEPGVTTTYAVMAALLLDLVFALTSALVVLGIVFARHERHYLKLVEQLEKPQSQGASKTLPG